MNFVEMNNFNSNLNEIKKETDIWNNKSRSDILTICINEKLKATLLLYMQGIEIDSDLLLHKKADKVFKAMNKIKRYNDKEVIEQYLVN